MPCENVLIKDVVTIAPETSVEDALEFIEEKRLRAMPVIDENNRLLGMFSLESLLKNLLPVSVTMEEGVNKLDFIVGAGPGIAKRFKKLKAQSVRDVMETDIIVSHITTPMWEVIRLIVKYGSPIPIIEEEGGTLLGIVTEQSCMGDIENILKNVEAQSGHDDE